MPPGWTSPSTPSGWRRTENALDLLAGSPVPDDLLPDDLGSRRRPGGDLRRAVLRGAAAPARHPAGREPAQGGQRQHRRRPGGVLPAHLPDRRRRDRQQRAVRPLRVRLRRLELRAADRHADLRRPHWSALQRDQGGPGDRRSPVREGDPDGLPGSGRCPGRPRHGGRAAGGAGVPGRGRRGDLSPLQPAATRRGSTATWASSMRSGPSTRRSRG